MMKKIALFLALCATISHASHRTHFTEKRFHRTHYEGKSLSPIKTALLGSLVSGSMSFLISTASVIVYDELITSISKTEIGYIVGGITAASTLIGGYTSYIIKKTCCNSENDRYPEV